MLRNDVLTCRPTWNNHNTAISIRTERTCFRPIDIPAHGIDGQVHLQDYRQIQSRADQSMTSLEGDGERLESDPSRLNFRSVNNIPPEVSERIC